MQRPAPTPPSQPLVASRESPRPLPATPPLTASPSADTPPGAPPETPAALWRAAQERLADRPSFVFLRHLRVVRLDVDTLLLTIAPGQREVQHVATPQRLELVAQVLTDLRGRRTRIELQPQIATAPTFDEPDTSESSQPGRSGQLDRRAALQLPLVRAAMQAFPDAMLIDAREEGEPDPSAPPDNDEAPAPPAPLPDTHDPIDHEEEP